MNNLVKKQTNIGIALAIIGFTLIGGALILIPKLVEEKAYMISSAKAAAECADSPQSADDVQMDMTTDAPSTADTTTPTIPSTGSDPAADAIDTEPTVPQPGGSTDSTTTEPQTPAATPSQGPWELTFAQKYELDDSSKQLLDSIIATIQKEPSMRLNIVGINNIMKSSKLAQLGANKIAGTIAKEAQIHTERLVVSVEQFPEIDNVTVKVSVVGGAQ